MLGQIEEKKKTIMMMLMKMMMKSIRVLSRKTGSFFTI